MRKWLLVCAAAMVLGGCLNESTMEQRQNKAMNDPFNYSAFDDKADTTSKNARSSDGSMQKDLKSVFNP